ncbi:hypothetical protein [Corynebacterium sp. LK2510]|uniref:hypothetical protein n=1 Tax=Corynebacterium sp. LK2510 TaxID=3110472 RepID=UPI0034CD27FE
MKKFTVSTVVAASLAASLVAAPHASAQSAAGEVLSATSSMSSGSSGSSNMNNLPTWVSDDTTLPEAPLGSVYSGSAPISLSIAAVVIGGIAALALNAGAVIPGLQLPDLQLVLAQFQQ